MTRSRISALFGAVVIAAASLCMATPMAWGGSETPPAGEINDALLLGTAHGLNEQERIDLGFEMTPVPLDMEGLNPRLVGLGSYMVNAAGSCNDCHTAPSYVAGGDPWKGQPEQINTANYLAGGRAFGPFTSRNITPDLVNGLPAGRTWDEFEQVMRDGVDFVACDPGNPPTCAPLLQVMPWPYYHDLTDHELEAIYEFLLAIPHAEPAS